MSLVRHGTGTVLSQRAVESKSNEIKAVPLLLLLQGRDLTGTVTTMDALLTQRAIAQQIVGAGGHYLMSVKANQGELCLATAELFACPPWLVQEGKANYRCYSKVEKGHGRLEKRTLESSPALREYMREYLDWPAGEQVMRRTCRRVVLTSGEVSEEVHYGVTSLRWEDADAEELEGLWREHWGIEIVQSQLTKTDMLAAGRGRDYIPDLDFLLVYNYPVDQQLHQLPLLFERSVF